MPLGCLSKTTMEIEMNDADEEIRGRLNDALTAAGVDVRNLAIEVSGGRVSVTGSVPDETQRQRAAGILAASQRSGAEVASRLEIVPVAAPDSTDGRGRSPLTGTSADSAHESRHQLD
jgi:osmotically-inducible protein OsmY